MAKKKSTKKKTTTKRKSKKQQSSPILVLLIIVLLLVGYYFRDQLSPYIEKVNTYLTQTLNDAQGTELKSTNEKVKNVSSLDTIPKYEGAPYVVLNNNEPNFDLTKDYSKSFEKYSELDSLGRCGVAFANIGTDIMPTTERGSIGSVKPSGWHTVNYNGVVEGNYLYNRCHLIAYELTGENANKQNLITCTRYMNASTMLAFENKVTKYIKKTNNHVLYRVTPIFEGDNLVASGAQMEGYSIEDKGEGIKFNVYVFNVQQGIVIDYKTGESRLAN